MGDRSEVVFSILMAAFVVVLVMTNVLAGKLFLAFPETFPDGLFGETVTLTAGLITYPLTFLITDVVCEVYGQRRANLMVYTGFAMSVLILGVIQIALVVPGSPVWPAGNANYDTVEQMQQAYESVFTLPGMLILGSMTAYLAAQLLDVKLFHFWKRVTRGKHLWLRNNASTMISQLADTCIVNSIFLGFGLGLAWDVVFKIIVASYLAKLVIALADTPFIYLGVWLVRRIAHLPDPDGGIDNLV
ncbi:queuosine precursor transporter [bacterium SCSIO 12827]|nr:queuosine precursor transporter [bacterium SCSIO 12827]